MNDSQVNKLAQAIKTMLVCMAADDAIPSDMNEFPIEQIEQVIRKSLEEKNETFVGIFAIEDDYKYIGKYFPNQNWNGYYVPYFDLETIQEIIEDINSEETVENQITMRGTTFENGIPVLHYVRYDDPETDNALPAIYDPEFEKHLYPLGGNEWCWQIVHDLGIDRSTMEYLLKDKSGRGGANKVDFKTLVEMVIDENDIELAEWLESAEMGDTYNGISFSVTCIGARE